MPEAKLLGFKPGSDNAAFSDSTSNQEAASVIHIFDAAAFHLLGHGQQLPCVDWAVSMKGFRWQLPLFFQPMGRLRLVRFLEALAGKNLDVGQLFGQFIQARKSVERSDQRFIPMPSPPVDFP